MTTLLQEAFAAAEKLPPDEQDVLASRLLAELADEDSFDKTIAQTAHKLVGMANAALAEHRASLTRDLDEQVQERGQESLICAMLQTSNFAPR